MLHSIAQPSTELPPSLDGSARTHAWGGREATNAVRPTTGLEKKRGGKKARQSRRKRKTPSSSSRFLASHSRTPISTTYLLRTTSPEFVRAVEVVGRGREEGQIRKCAHRRRGFFFSFFVFLSFFRGEAVYFSKSALLQVLVRRCALRSRGAHEIGGGESPRLGSHLCLLLLLLLIPPSFPLCFGKGGVGSGVQAGYGMVVAQLRERGGGGRWEKSFVRSSRKGREKEEGRGGRMDTSSSPPRKLIFFPMPHHDIHQGHSRCLPPLPVLCYSTN